MSDNTPKDKDSLDPEKIKELNDKVDSIKENIRKGVEELKKTEALINAQKADSLKSLAAKLASLGENVDGIDLPKSEPEEMFIIPTFGRPVMPSQITPMQIKSDYEEIITQIAQSEKKTFAIFAIDEKLEKKGKIRPSDFPKMGTLVKLLHAKAVPGEVHFVCEGIERVTIQEWKSFNGSPKAVLEYPENEMPEPGTEDEVKVKAYAMNLVSLLQELLPLNPMYSDEMRQYLLRFDQNDPSLLADCAASVTTTSAKSLQKVLDCTNILKRLELSQDLLQKELKAAKLHDEIKTTVNEKLSRKQKEYVLREQLKQIQKELGTRADSSSEADEYVDRMKKLSPPDYITKRFEKELKKLNTLTVLSGH